MTYAGIVGYAFESGGHEGDCGLAVRPVVSLKSEITKNEISKITDKVEDNWNYNANAGPQ